VLGCALLKGFMCLAVHCYRVMCALLYTVTGLYVLGCTRLRGYVCFIVHCYRVECYILLWGYVCLVIHCYRIACACLHTVAELYMLQSLTVFILMYTVAELRMLGCTL